MGSETRCAHYDSERDIVALRFGCCERYYACHRCHVELTDHEGEPWPTNRKNESAAVCGVCETTLSASEYMNTDACPECRSPFNPGCADHYHLYFEWVDGVKHRE